MKHTILWVRLTTDNTLVLLRAIIGDAIEGFPKCASLHLLHSYILHGKLFNQFKYLISLMFAGTKSFTIC